MPLDGALSSYPDVQRKVPMHGPKDYNNKRISIDYRFLIMVNTRQTQGQLNNNKEVSVKSNDCQEAYVSNVERLESVFTSRAGNYKWSRKLLEYLPIAQVGMENNNSSSDNNTVVI